MGRPKGLRKDKVTGEWYRLEDRLQPEPVIAKPEVRVIEEEATVSRRKKPIEWQRNDIVRVDDGVRKTALVQGFKDGKVMVQLIQEVNTMLLLDASRIHSITEAEA